MTIMRIIGFIVGTIIFGIGNSIGKHIIEKVENNIKNSKIDEAPFRKSA